MGSVVSAQGEAEFAEFVRARGPALLRTACLLAGGREDGQDLLQAALVKAVRHWPRIGGGGAEAYVRRVLVTTAIDRGRRARWRELATRRVPEHGRDDDALRGAEDRDVLFAALRALPAGQRAVLVLRFYADMSEAQTAEHLGVSVGTVKSQAARGLRALRAALPEHQERS